MPNNKRNKPPRRTNDMETERGIQKLLITVTRLEERALATSRQLEINSTIIRSLKDQHMQTQAAVAHLEEKYNTHLKESSASDNKLDAFVLDYERIKAKGGLVILMVSIVGIAVWQGVISWFSKTGPAS